MLWICVDRKYRIGNKKSIIPCGSKVNNYFNFVSSHLTLHRGQTFSCKQRTSSLSSRRCYCLDISTSHLVMFKAAGGRMPNSEESAVDHGGTDRAHFVRLKRSILLMFDSTTFHTFVHFWCYCPIISYFCVDLLFVSCTVPCTSKIWYIGKFGKRWLFSLQALHGAVVSSPDTTPMAPENESRLARTVLDLVVSYWVISIAQHCTRCHDMKETKLMRIRLKHVLAKPDPESQNCLNYSPCMTLWTCILSRLGHLGVHGEFGLSSTARCHSKLGRRYIKKDDALIAGSFSQILLPKYLHELCVCWGAIDESDPQSKS